MKTKKLRLLAIILITVIFCEAFSILPSFALDALEEITTEPIEESIQPIQDENIYNESGYISTDVTIVEGSDYIELPMEEITDNPSVGEGSAELQDYTVISSSIIPDGVYAIRNYANGNLWMGVQQNILVPGYHVQQYTFPSNPAEAYLPTGLFKITRVEGTRRYIIRWMMNNLITLDCPADASEASYILTKTIPADDSDVDINDTFYINYSTNGYTIQPYNSSYYVCARATTASGAAGAPESYLIQSTNAVQYSRVWEFQQYTGIDRTHFSISYTRSVTNGLEKGLSTVATVYSGTTVLNTNDCYAEIPTEYQSVASGSWNASTNKLTINALATGRLRVYFSFVGENAADITTVHYTSYMITPPINTGENCVVHNMGTRRYMDVEGPSTAEGANIQQWEISTAATQKRWIIEKTTSGYYTIKSAFSNKYVGVDSTSGTAVKQYGTVSDYTKWIILERSSGDYSFHCVALGETLALSSQSDSSQNGSDLRMLTYTNNTSYKDEWNVYLCQYTITVNHYYDQAYNIRFSDSNGTALSKLQSYTKESTDIFLRNFNILLINQYNSFTSCADQCRIAQDGSVNSTNILEMLVCTHSEEHSETGALLRSSTTGTRLSPVVVWTGHILEGNPRSVWYSTYRIAITPYHTTTAQNGIYNNRSDYYVEMNSLHTFTHEMSHQLGAPDHYCYNGYTTKQQYLSSGEPCVNSDCDICVKGESAIRNDCIMAVRSSNKLDLRDSNIHCDDCKNNISEYLSTYH